MFDWRKGEVAEVRQRDRSRMDLMSMPREIHYKTLPPSHALFLPSHSLSHFTCLRNLSPLPLFPPLVPSALSLHRPGVVVSYCLSLFLSAILHPSSHSAHSPLGFSQTSPFRRLKTLRRISELTFFQSHFEQVLNQHHPSSKYFSFSTTFRRF